MKTVIIDTEATDAKDPELIEVAAVTVSADPCSLKKIAEYEERFKPEKPISLGAMAVHHIMEEDLTDCKPSSDFKFPGGVDFIIGHNVDFDWQVVGSPDVKRICTLALCRAIWPDLDSHTQSAMLYHLERNMARDKLKNAHSAIYDCFVCYDILKYIVKATCATTWQELWEASEIARIPTIMVFGKHKGTPMAEVPRDYKDWLLKQDDVDPYLRIALTK
jgi:exodeoxyribonuclease X